MLFVLRLKTPACGAACFADDKLVVIGHFSKRFAPGFGEYPPL